MTARFFRPAILGIGLLAMSGHAYSADVKLSPQVLDLLRAEMREVSAGVQAMAFSIASADWRTIQDTSARIRASYIMEKKLTPAQARELETALPQRFKLLDADFHDRAAKLGAAAAAHDSKLVVAQYSRMLESCTTCHAAFASSRFPNFSPGNVKAPRR
jgi:cytochrome c556